MPSSAMRQFERLPRRPATRIPTVCVVDPDPDDYQGWDSLAEANGSRLEIVATAKEALRLARTKPVDLWVVNVELPGLSGFELCNMLKERFADNAVYLVTDTYAPSIERAAWAASATLFDVKPMHLAGFQQWLEHRRHRWCESRESM